MTQKIKNILAYGWIRIMQPYQEEPMQQQTILQYLLLQAMPGLNIIPVKKMNTMMKEHCSTNHQAQVAYFKRLPGRAKTIYSIPLKMRNVLMQAVSKVALIFFTKMVRVPRKRAGEEISFNLEGTPAKAKVALNWCQFW